MQECTHVQGLENGVDRDIGIPYQFTSEPQGLAASRQLSLPSPRLALTRAHTPRKAECIVFVVVAQQGSNTRGGGGHFNAVLRNYPW